MRISGGSAKGVRLRVPAGTRPSSERVRQALFSSLRDAVAGARVLDLFCGSGAYGLEALSRGAASAVFVDVSAAAVTAARANAAAAGFADRCAARRSDAVSFLRRTKDVFDLVFADPPYDADISDAIFGPLHRVLAPGGLVVVETRRGGPDRTVAGYDLRADRRYGDTRVRTFLRSEER